MPYGSSHIAIDLREVEKPQIMKWFFKGYCFSAEQNFERKIGGIIGKGGIIEFLCSCARAPGGG